MANIQKKILIGEKWLEKKYGKLTILINKIIEKNLFIPFPPLYFIVYIIS